MDKQQLLLKLHDIGANIRPDRKDAPPFKGGCHNHGHEDFKMPPSAGKILTVLFKEEKMNQRTLAKSTNITAQGVSDVLKKMESRDLVVKVAGEACNENFIILTEKGKKIATDMDVKSKAHAERIFASFSVEEMCQLESLLEKIYQNTLDDSEV